MHSRPPLPDAATLKRGLAARVESLVRELLPNGSRQGSEWVSPSLRGTSQRALSVHLTGAKAGVWAEFDSGASGDALSLVAHVLYAGDLKRAYRWALSWLGYGGPVPIAAVPAPSPAATAEHEAEQRARKAKAQRLWLINQPSLSGTPAAAYLAARGIDLGELQRQPRSLRYGAAVFNRETDTSLPCLLAAISGPTGEHVATHRTWLASDSDGIWRKAPLKDPKMSFGTYAGGCIRLWRGASKKPLHQAPESDVVAIAEGIETALSVAIACPEMRVLAAVSLANLGRIILPPSVLDVIVCADNDTGNPAAEAALQRAADRLLREGRSVRIARSSFGKDFNDSLASAA